MNEAVYIIVSALRRIDGGRERARERTRGGWFDMMEERDVLRCVAMWRERMRCDAALFFEVK